MSRVHRIAEIEIAAVSLPRKETIALRYGSISTLDNVFVAIRTEDGVVGELLLGNQYGHRLHVWDWSRRAHRQEVDLVP